MASDLTELEASASSVRVLREHQETLQEANERLRVQAKELQTRAEELQIGGQALRESEERFRTLADNMSQFAWMADKDGRLFWYNRRWYEYTGTTLEEMQGWGWQKVHHPDHVQRVTEKFRQHLRTGEVWEDTFPLRGEDGRYRWFLSRAVAVRDEQGNVLRWFGTNTDITEQREADEALRELARTLETRVAQRTQELQHRTQQLQKLTFQLSQAEDRERKQLAEVLHEDLQQLLVAATFHLSLLKRRVGYDPSQQAIAAKVDQILQDAITKARSLSHELSPAVLHHSNLVVIFTWLAGQVQAKHGLIVRVDAFREVIVQSDALKALLYKAAQEMLLNVVKHARVNEARIRVRRVGRCVCLSVSDHGRGFDPRKLKETAGYGLLSIRERIELLGGRMKINSARGKGGTLHIVVPDGESPGTDVRVKARTDRSHQEGLTLTRPERVPPARAAGGRPRDRAGGLGVAAPRGGQHSGRRPGGERPRGGGPGRPAAAGRGGHRCGHAAHQRRRGHSADQGASAPDARSFDVATPKTGCHSQQRPQCAPNMSTRRRHGARDETSCPA